jgi:hypothetical protein
MPRVTRSLPLPSSARGGPAYLYLLPCLGEDLLKLGFSRDPLSRMQSLHPRFYEFFDLEQGCAVQTETVHDARRLELSLARRLRAHSAPSPLTIRAAAGGASEWYRGAQPTLLAEFDALRRLGHRLVELSTLVRAGLMAQAADLYAWSSLLSPAELEARGALARTTAAQRHVVDVLDGYLACAIDVRPLLPAAAADWHRAASLRPASELR